MPDNLTFAANTQATYNVIEASCKLGVRKVSALLPATMTLPGVADTARHSLTHCA